MIGGNRYSRNNIYSFFSQTGGSQNKPTGNWVLYHSHDREVDHIKDHTETFQNIKCICHNISRWEEFSLYYAKNNRSQPRIMTAKSSDFYLKVKTMKVYIESETLSDEKWQWYVKSKNFKKVKYHYCTILLLCVKSQKSEDDDLEFFLCSFGCPETHDGSAKVLFPDPIYQGLGWIDYSIDGTVIINSDTTTSLDMRESEKIVELLDILINNPGYNFNINSQIINSSKDFADFIFILLSNFRGRAFGESLLDYQSKNMKYNSTYKIAEYLLTEYEYYKNNKPTMSQMPPCHSSQGDISPQSSSETQLSPMSDATDVTITTEVGEPSPQQALEPEPELDHIQNINLDTNLGKCFKENPCLKLLFDELKKDKIKADIRKKRKSKRKKKSKKSKRRKKTKRRKSKKKSKKR